ncbi:hypothetical protein [Anaerotignum sp.]|uniref:hypothetical protein n=1 Tax=Anaerotignum sp. TaxID=2039241 RepID=UPI00332E5BD0
MKNKRLCAALLAIFIVFTLFYSIFFVASKTNHECTGKSCPICHDIQSCVQTIRSLILAIVAAPVFVGSIFIIVHITAPMFFLFVNHTLVSLKVKLTN